MSSTLIYQYLNETSLTVTVPSGYSSNVQVYAWGAGGGDGYNGGGGGGDTYQRTVSYYIIVFVDFSTSGFGAPRLSSTTTETITVAPGVIPAPGVNDTRTRYSAWTKISSGSSDGRAIGGGGGFVQGIINVNSGDTMVISVGGTGGRGPRDGRGIGGDGNNPVISFDGGTTGVGAPYPGNDDQYYGAGGGGGAASAVLVNGIPMIVAAGGGGGGGGTAYQTGSSGTAGGVTTAAATTSQGGTSTGGYSVGGAGGAGYPYGGAGGQTVGDDAGAATGGYGGQNYANATVFASTLTAGSGLTPGGVTSAFYPRAKRGYAGYNGAVILIFTKTFTSHIKQSGSWQLINRAWSKIPSRQIPKAIVSLPETILYTSSGTSSFTVPAGVTTIDLNVVGAGGGGGGSDSSPGAGGRSGARISGTLAVSPGQTLTISIGSGGLGAASDQGSAPGGRAGTNTLGYKGGAGSAAGPVPLSGGGGGGGAASVVLLSGSPVAVASGGGGGGGGGNGVPGQGVSPGGTSGGIAGGDGQIKGGDGGGAGGGGGGYPLGGAGGSVNGGDVGGNSGADGQSLVPSGFALSSGANGGLSGIRGSRAAGNGDSGSVSVTYTLPTEYITVEAGGWKEILKGWIKQNGTWKLIESSNPLIPAVNSRAPTDYVTINIVISADTNNYNLIDFLSGYGYYAGRSLINLIVNAGVIVGSGSAGAPALNITGMTAGDIVNVINNGSIIGKGGDGGAAGSYTSVTTGGTPVTNSCFLPGTLVSTPNGYVTIETIQVGDLVYAYNIGPDFNNSIALEPKTVTKTYTHTWDEANQITPLLIITHSQGELIVTPEHELLCLDKVDPNSDYPGFVRVDALAVGDIIYAEDGSELTITNISNGPNHYEYVYNIEVDDFHTYVANSVRVHNGQTNPAPKGGYTIATTTIRSVPGRPGENGGPALYTTYNITLANNGIIAGGGGGGGGGGGPTGGQGGGGAGTIVGSGANNGTATAGGAGVGLGGAGGARGTAGSAGTNQSNAGGVGGEAGIAIIGYNKVTLNVEGTILGPRNVG